MKIALIEPFFGGSHRQWAEGLVRNSRHEIELFTLPGRHWKWRMHGAAVTLAGRFLETSRQADLILASDMLDLGLFLALTRSRSASTPVALYFHENQLTYPWSPQDRDVQNARDHHYAFINYSSALLADRVFFNSRYHRESFCNALPGFLKSFPPPNNKEGIEIIEKKSRVLPLGMDLKKFDPVKEEKRERPKRGVILWNHRWEYDKAPESFFRVLKMLKERGVAFHLIVLGSRSEKYPPVFDEARHFFQEELLHFGYAESFEEYARWLCLSDILPVTSIQDFFGGSVVEAMYCNVKPLLPLRLAYPGHVPESLHASFFYPEDDERELANRLQQRLFSIPLLRKQKTEQFVARYDWQSLTGQYDRALTEVTRSASENDRGTHPGS